MCCAIEFIETPLVTRQIKPLATDDELRALQKERIGNPDAGDIIQNTGATENQDGDRCSGEKRQREGDLFPRNRREPAWVPLKARRNPTGHAAKVLAAIQANPALFREMAKY